GNQVAGALLGGLVELPEQRREIDLTHQGRRQHLGGGAPDSRPIRFRQRSLVRIDDPNIRNAGGQIVPDLGEHFRDLVVRRYDLDDQVRLQQNGGDLVRQGLYADIGNAVTRLVAHLYPQLSEDTEPAFSR